MGVPPLAGVLFFTGSALAQGHHIQDLGPGIALDINHSGRVVGISGEFGFHFDGVAWESVTHLSTPNPLSPSDPPARIPATGSSLVAINDSGERVGTVTTATGILAVIRISGTHMTTIDNRPSTIHPPVVTGINDSGLVSGGQVSAPDGHNNGLQIGGTLGVPNFSRLHAVNASGTFAGSWGARSVAYDINTAGQVVGEAETIHGVMHAFRWSDGVMVDLNRLLPPGADGWELITAKAINDRGEIVGQGRFQGSLRAFLLSPPGLVTPPWIKASPQGARLALGQSLTLGVEARGFGRLTYQCIRSGTPVANATDAMSATLR